MAVKDVSLGWYGVSTSKVLLQYVTAPDPLCQRGHTINKTLGEGQGASITYRLKWSQVHLCGITQINCRKGHALIFTYSWKCYYKVFLLNIGLPENWRVDFFHFCDISVSRPPYWQMVITIENRYKKQWRIETQIIQKRKRSTFQSSDMFKRKPQWWNSQLWKKNPTVSFFTIDLSNSA